MRSAILLNTNIHASVGLMRAGRSRRELHSNAPTDWRFLEAEAAKMRAAVARR